MGFKIYAELNYITAIAQHVGRKEQEIKQVLSSSHCLRSSESTNFIRLY